MNEKIYKPQDLGNENQSDNSFDSKNREMLSAIFEDTDLSLENNQTEKNTNQEETLQTDDSDEVEKRKYFESAQKKEKGGRYAQAAKSYTQAGYHDKAKEMWISAAKDYESSNSFGHAAEYYKNAGESEKAKEMWTKEAEIEEAEGKYEIAADTYELAGNIEKAKEMKGKLIKEN